MSRKILLDRIAELSDDARHAVAGLHDAVHPPAELAGSPGNQIEWSEAEWCVRAWNDADHLVTYVGVLWRPGKVNGQPVKIGGIGGVKTHPKARRQGHAAACIERAVEFLAEQSVDWGLLVCRDELIDYYSRLGWHEFRGELHVTQHGQPEVFTFNRPMLIPVTASLPNGGTIDLMGPPW